MELSFKQLKWTARFMAHLLPRRLRSGTRRRRLILSSPRRFPNEPNASVQSLPLGQGVRNAQLTCLQSPPLEACRVEEARQLGHQSGPQAEETPVPRPRFLERRLPAARKLPPY